MTDASQPVDFCHASVERRLLYKLLRSDRKGEVNIGNMINLILFLIELELVLRYSIRYPFQSRKMDLKLEYGLYTYFI